MAEGENTNQPVAQTNTNEQPQGIRQVTTTDAQQQVNALNPVQRPFIYDELRRVKNNANEAGATKLDSTNKQE